MTFTTLSFLQLIHGLFIIVGGNVSYTICYKYNKIAAFENVR